jgi:SEC-C motif-containing protein
MRSRYSAYVVRDTAYLLRTWHPDTRPQVIGFADAPRWTGLEVLATTGGSAFHATGTVTFRARFTERGRPGDMWEHSRFTRFAGVWVYVDGDEEGDGSVTAG